MKAIKMKAGRGSRKEGGGIDIQGLRRRFSIYKSEQAEEIMDDRVF